MDEIFDVISYRKGASVIRMLHDYIGDEVSNDLLAELIMQIILRTKNSNTVLMGIYTKFHSNFLLIALQRLLKMNDINKVEYLKNFVLTSDVITTNTKIYL